MLVVVVVSVTELCMVSSVPRVCSVVEEGTVAWVAGAVLGTVLGTVLGVVCIVVGCVAFVTVGFAVSEAGPLRQAVSIHAESTNAIARIAVFFIFNPPEV